MAQRLPSPLLAALLLAACATPTVNEPSPAHLRADDRPAAGTTIPQPVPQPLAAPKPRAPAGAETYSVVVNKVKVHELLFALAREAGINIDIHPGISGYVTLNAIDQTLPELLARIARQVELRVETDGANLVLMPDTPFLRSYQVNYVNMARDTTSTVATNTQIAAGGIPGSASAGAQAGGNASRIQIRNESRHRFWESLEKNIRDLLQDTDKERIISRRATESTEALARQNSLSATAAGSGAVAGAGTPVGAALSGSGNQTAQSQTAAHAQGQRQNDSRDYETVFAANVIVNSETGVVSVRGTSRQHEKIREFIDQVGSNARRQVMIEATVVEVELSEGYQQGIDWERLADRDRGFTRLTPPKLPGDPASSLSPFSLRYRNTGALGLTANIQLLEAYGNTKILSSPKLSVLNNQTATLKVSEDVVYFNVRGDTTAVGNNAAAIKSFTTTPQTVSVGFFMSVTPQIGDSGAITLNVRPSISSIAAFVTDPNPDIPADIPNRIPQIRTREMESVLRLEGGEIAVLGGLMEDRRNDVSGRIPGIGAVPLLGEIFTQRNNNARKTELVVFIRPTLINAPSIGGDYASLKEFLPGRRFFEVPAVHLPLGRSRPGPTADSRLRISRGEPRIVPGLAEAYAQLLADDLAGAAQSYRRALHTEPGNADALLGMAALAFRRGHSAAAEGWLLRAVAADPGNAEAQAGLISLRRQADPARAESRLKALLAAQPGSTTLNAALGELYAGQGRWPEARLAYFNAHATDPDNPDHLFNLAASLDQLQQAGPAVDYYRAALAASAGQRPGFDNGRAQARIRELQR